VLIAGHGVRDFHVFMITALLVSGLLYDWRTRGTPHPALLWGGVLLIASQLTRRFVGAGDVWSQIGNWLLN
jgi:hypothetical protein